VSAGDTFEVSAGSLDAELARRAPSVEVEVPDRIGDGASRRVALRIGGLRTFTLAGVADAVPELKGLLALAARPPADAALAAAEVARLAGAGRLSRACAEAAAPAAAPPARGPDPRAAAAVDAFVGAAKGATPPGAPAGAARRLRDAIEAAVYGTALDVLRAEPVARLEGTWRGLRLLAERCPKGADMHVEAIDVEPGRLPALLAARPASDAFEEPDAVLVVDPVADLETLGALAEAAEAMLAPCVAEVAPALACAGGAAGAEDLAARLDRGGAAPPGWDALRAGDASRWLCAAVNRVALDESLRTRMGQAGRRRAEDHFSWAAIARQTFDLYASLLGG